MMHKDWKDAHTAAVKLARELDQEVGIRHAKWFNQRGYVVQLLPRADKRFGSDARCEVVKPTDPL
jgi:hypothetical protein